MSEKLREPKGAFQEVVRRLAEEAIAVTHHDIGEHEPEYISEVRSMERRFTNVLRGYLSARSREAGRAMLAAAGGPHT